MSEWTVFNFEIPRPHDAPVYTEDDRYKLEKCVAKQITFLLSSFGETEEVELDSSDCIGLADPKTFATLELEPITMDNDHLLLIGQMPYAKGEIDTEQGRHSLQVEDENGALELGLWVLDASIIADRYVRDISGNPPKIDLLAETIDALNVVAAAHHKSEIYNFPLLDTSLYPLAISDAEFLAIVAQI